MSDPAILRRSVFITGPTSVGKSEVALSWARKHGGEIVCADAFQLYREFPVLSAQPAPGETAGVPHHLFGSVPCSEEMDAARYADTARTALENIIARGGIPFVVGGSGLYLQALMAGLPQLPAIDPSIRQQVRGMALTTMLGRLQQLDPASLLVIDVHNPRRVARRLELCLQTGLPASEILVPAAMPPGLRGVTFTRDLDDLRGRIAAAVDARLAGGAIDEVRASLHVAGSTARQILGWREIGDYLDQKISFEECRDRLIAATRQYAKRQLTWFRAKSTFALENLSTVTPDELDRIALRAGLP